MYFSKLEIIIYIEQMANLQEAYCFYSNNIPTVKSHVA